MFSLPPPWAHPTLAALLYPALAQRNKEVFVDVDSLPIHDSRVSESSDFTTLDQGKKTIFFFRRKSFLKEIRALHRKRSSQNRHSEKNWERCNFLDDFPNMTSTHVFMGNNWNS